MADQQDLRGSNLEKDPADWKTGDEPMTGAQASYLRTLSDQASEPFDEELTKAEASRRTTSPGAHRPRSVLIRRPGRKPVSGRRRRAAPSGPPAAPSDTERHQ